MLRKKYIYHVGDKVEFIGYKDEFSEEQGWEIGDTAEVTQYDKDYDYAGDGMDVEDWIRVERDSDNYTNSYPAKSFTIIKGRHKKHFDIPKSFTATAKKQKHKKRKSVKHLDRYEIIMRD
jgi:hypothetical protein